MDAEWGVSMRLDSVQKFPWMMSLGACLDDNLIYQFGKVVRFEDGRSLPVRVVFGRVDGRVRFIQ